MYFKILFIPVMQSLLKSSISHDPSEIILICWFDDWETFLIGINIIEDGFIFVKTVILLG